MKGFRVILQIIKVMWITIKI